MPASTKVCKRVANIAERSGRTPLAAGGVVGLVDNAVTTASTSEASSVPASTKVCNASRNLAWRAAGSILAPSCSPSPRPPSESSLVSSLLAIVDTGALDAEAPPETFINNPAPAPINKPAVTPITANFFVLGFVSFVSIICFLCSWTPSGVSTDCDS